MLLAFTYLQEEHTYAETCYLFLLLREGGEGRLKKYREVLTYRLQLAKIEITFWRNKNVSLFQNGLVI